MRKNPEREYRRHSILVAVFAIYLLVVSVSSVYAARLINYTSDVTEEVIDEFVPVEARCTVKDNGNGTYTITNDSSMGVYLRFTVVPAWENLSDGRIYWQAPNCTVTLTASEWMSSADGYHYRVTPLNAGQSVTVTVGHSVTDAPPNHVFKVKLVAEVIQSEPVSAMQEAWGVNMVPNSQSGNQGGLVDGGEDNPQQGAGGTQ